MTHLYRIHSRDDIKSTFAYTRPIAEVVALDYRQRFEAGEFTVREDVTYGIDAGGMIIVDMPTRTVAVGDLVFEFWCHQARWAERRLRRALERIRGEGPAAYVKVHGRWTCLAVPVGVADELLAKVSAVAEDAEREADEFIAKHCQRMDKAQLMRHDAGARIPK